MLLEELNEVFLMKQLAYSDRHIGIENTWELDIYLRGNKMQSTCLFEVYNQVALSRIFKEASFSLFRPDSSVKVDG